MLRAGIRPYDICVRYAGDEFIVVLSGCGGEEAERKRLELQRAVDELQFEARPGKMLPLAISIGAAVFPHDGDSYETLLATADSRMYRDKTRRKREPAQRAAGSEPSNVSDVDVSRRSGSLTPAIRIHVETSTMYSCRGGSLCLVVLVLMCLLGRDRGWFVVDPIRASRRSARSRAMRCPSRRDQRQPVTHQRRRSGR